MRKNINTHPNLLDTFGSGKDEEIETALLLGTVCEIQVDFNTVFVIRINLLWVVPKRKKRASEEITDGELRSETITYWSSRTTGDCMICQLYT